jgi:hypothetical protein
MPLPASGAIRLGADVNVILSFSSTAQISLGATGVRALYSVPSGAIRLATDGYGKSPAGASGASGAGGGSFNYSTATGDITGGTITNFGSYYSISIGTNSTVVRDALIATTAGTTLNMSASSGLNPSPSAFTAYSAGGLVAGNNGPTAGGMFGAFIYAQNTSAMVTYGNTVIAINNMAAVQYNLVSSMIMANNFTLYFVSSIDADAAAIAMTSGTAISIWDASGGKLTGTVAAGTVGHAPGSNSVYHSFSSTPSYMMDMSGITNRIQIG